MEGYYLLLYLACGYIGQARSNVHSAAELMDK